jgi:protocatechuate 3,4-dioxygenase beta subunit
VDERGAYEITGIDAGQNYGKVTVEDEEGMVRANVALGYLNPGKVTVWDAEIGAIIKIHGRILGETSGKPILDAEFTVWAVRDGHAVADVYLRPPRHGGAYALELSSVAGEYRICVTYDPFSHNGFDQYGETVQLQPGDDQTIDLRIAEPYRIAVRAVDEHGDPVEGAVVEGHRPGTSGKIGATDAEGRFSMGGIMPDILKHESNASMILRHPEYCEACTRSYVGNPGEVFPEETVVLYRPASLEGQVVDSEGQPIAKMGVGIVLRYGEEVRRSLSGITNRDGIFRFPDGVPATDVTLEVTVWHDASKSKQTWTFDPIAIDAGACVDLGTLVFIPSTPQAASGAVPGS